MNETTPPVLYCGTGQRWREDLQQHDKAIEDAQRRMRELRQAPDSIDQQVPRSLHEALSTHISQRALTNLQWRRHLDTCGKCTAAESQAIVAA
jgi:hypothetical protein